MTAEAVERPSRIDRMLGGIERAGNKVPHPVMIFLALIALILVLSHVFYLAGSEVSYEQAVVTTDVGSEASLGEDIVEGDEPVTETVTVAAKSLLTADGLRFIFTSPVANFNNFGVVGVIVVAMIGVGFAEATGLIGAFIKRLVKVTPRRFITFSVVLLGVLSSIATDAGYLVLIPLAAAVFYSLGRHPLAGLAAAFAGVGGGFGVNLLITPADGMLTEITNESIPNPADHVAITGNIYFGIVSTILIAVLATWVTEKIVEPRLGRYDAQAEAPDPSVLGDGSASEHELTAPEKRGLRFAGWGLLGVTAVVLALSLPPNAVLRNPETGSLLEGSPLMSSIIFLILVYFFVMGLCYGKGAGTVKGSMDVIDPMTKTIAGLAGLIFLLLVISQFIAYFNYSNLGTIAAVNMADVLEAAGLHPVWLLLGFVLMTAVIDIFIGGVVPKWAIFAPIFVPLFIQLGLAPELALAAYRVGDSPINIVTPLMPYFALIVIFAEKYHRKTGVGSIISLMLPYTVVLMVAWTALLIVWYLIGLPLGPGAPVTLG
ncbi:AbgT family transporter [Cellulomonas soli]|uniref:p-aminobenzoyl-glutamate transporter n=1 Tax=Cellulomonas soli TaxID=931535 RepID=A0A512PFC5_9CELL|nr:AbgT family transporter [Cellulomonas soli]NYI59296.1 aminobenzoyl-glutamate transport protein [Cellulomonas soli]GEP69915.1 p-aminobenzoyl-glutamate transporter [Cellulomonas soli]